MAQIRVFILDHTGGTKTEVELPDDVPILRLLPALVDSMGMPQIHGGTAVKYRLDHKASERLGEDLTLASAGIRPGDTLSLLPEVTAGCFPPGTTVALPDGENACIERLTAGDSILSYDPANETYHESRVAAIESHQGSNKLISINGIVEITFSHLVYVCGGGWRPAGELKIGDRFHHLENGQTTVSSIERVAVAPEVFNLHLAPRTHTFFANNVLVHNAQLKGALAIDEAERFEVLGERRRSFIELERANDIELERAVDDTMERATRPEMYLRKYLGRLTLQARANAISAVRKTATGLLFVVMLALVDTGTALSMLLNLQKLGWIGSDLSWLGPGKWLGVVCLAIFSFYSVILLGLSLVQLREISALGDSINLEEAGEDDPV